MPLKEVFSRRISWASAGVLLTQSLGSSGSRCITITSWSRWGSGSGFHNMASQMLKVAVVAPMPSAMVTTAVRVKPGELRSVRAP